MKKIGLVLILAGFFLQLAAIALVGNYEPKLGFIGSMDRMEVVLHQGRFDREAFLHDAAVAFVSSGNVDRINKSDLTYYPDRVSIGYRSMFIIALLVFFSGATLLVFSGGRSFPVRMPLQKTLSPRGRTAAIIALVVVLAAALGLARELWPNAFWLRIGISMIGIAFFCFLIGKRRSAPQNNPRWRDGLRRLDAPAHGNEKRI